MSSDSDSSVQDFANEHFTRNSNSALHDTSNNNDIGSASDDKDYPFDAESEPPAAKVPRMECDAQEESDVPTDDDCEDEYDSQEEYDGEKEEEELSKTRPLSTAYITPLLRSVFLREDFDKIRQLVFSSVSLTLSFASLMREVYVSHYFDEDLFFIKNGKSDETRGIFGYCPQWVAPFVLNVYLYDVYSPLNLCFYESLLKKKYLAVFNVADAKENWFSYPESLDLFSITHKLCINFKSLNHVKKFFSRFELLCFAGNLEGEDFFSKLENFFDGISLTTLQLHSYAMTVKDIIDVMRMYQQELQHVKYMYFHWHTPNALSDGKMLINFLTSTFPGATKINLNVTDHPFHPKLDLDSNFWSLMKAEYNQVTAILPGIPSQITVSILLSVDPGILFTKDTPLHDRQRFFPPQDFDCTTQDSYDAKSWVMRNRRTDFASNVAFTYCLRFKNVSQM